MLTVMALIYLCFCFAAFFFGSSMFRLLSGLTGSFFVFYFLLVYRVRVWVPVATALMMLGIAVLKVDSSFQASLFFVLSLFSSVCLAILIRDYGLGRVLITVPLLLYSLFLLYLFSVLEFGPNEFNSVFDGYSRNGVGAVLLAFSMGYVWYCYEKDLKPSLFLGALVLFLMFPLYGRANIIGGAVLFGLMLYLNFGFVGLLFLGLLLSVGSVLGFDYISGYLSVNTNFSSGLESLRSEMLRGYAEQTNLGSFFLGTKLSAVESIVDHGGNAHNAFLRAHSYFGLMSFCVILAFAAAVALMLSNGQFVLAIISLVLIARASLDIIYLGNIFDFLMLGPFLYFYRPIRSTVCL
ncbi:hypothetical protein DOQ08_01242 [Marinobacter litoralis]|uniref:O-Antigen ligase n=1 Tax=Marinobacter litoralis TaxID=187981 RepID=A0A3M2RF62_9GAMM|nr:hypothetical protein [Marinobacter litoralis]RMJ03922.1 hypothetical protein DOQ08_01242 [Marinobacter litoralis]